MGYTDFKPKYFALIYLVIVLLDLYAGSGDSTTLRHFTKPMILISLFVYFAINGRQLEKSTFNMMLLALLFSWLGDVMLMYEYISSTYFALGLASFLTAHILYTLLFLKKWERKNSRISLMILFLLSSYGTVLFLQLQDNLGELRIPVIIYVIAIMAMAITAFKRKGNTNKASFILVFVGALFFIASDSILAINKFLIDVPYSHLLIMSTYATAQFLITQGVLVQKIKINNV